MYSKIPHLCCLVFMLSLAVSCAFAQSNGADSIYYSPRVTYMSYPSHKISPQALSRKESTRNALLSMRMTDVNLRNYLTPEKMDAIAKELSQKGFNIIISEGERYLFSNDPPAGREEAFTTARMMADACHKYGMKLILHQTSTMVTPQVLAARPDWGAIDMLTGTSLINRYATGNTCISNDDFMAEFYKLLAHLVKESGADGLQLDEIQFFSSSLCGCKWCREKFHKATGYELPDKEHAKAWLNFDNEEYQVWLAWRRAEIASTMHKVDSILKENNPNAVLSNYLCNNSSYWAYRETGLVINDYQSYADCIGYECEPPNYDYLHYWPLNIVEMKYLRAVAERMDSSMWTLFYPKRVSDYTWTWFLGMSQGSRLWWWRKIGREAAPGVWEPMLAWEANHENLLRNLKSAANIGVLYSLDTRFRNLHCEGPVCFMSTCYALTDYHIPYKVIVDEDMTADQLSRKVNTLILFDTGSMPDSQITAVREFVKNGGTLIASASTSLYDEKGTRRPDFGLADVFGFNYAGEVQKTTCKFNIPAQNEVSGSITGDFASQYYCVRIKDLARSARVLGQMTLPDGSTFPGMVVNTYGKGRVVYFSGRTASKYDFFYSGSPGQNWTDNRDQKYGALVAAAVACNNPSIPVVIKNVPAGVVVEAYRHKDGDTKGVQVHLANFTGGVVKSGIIPSFSDISYPDVKASLPDPSRPISITVKLDGVRKVYLFSPDFDGAVSMPFTAKGGSVTVNLDGFARYAVLYFSQGDDKEIIRACGGKALKTVPKAGELVWQTQAPLAGSYDPESTVVFADSNSFTGGYKMDGWYKYEPARMVYGSLSNCSRMTATINLATIPASPMMEIGAMSDNHPESIVPIEIKLNGETVFKGASTYPHDVWAVKSFELKPGALHPGMNTVEIENKGEGPIVAPPWLGVSYIRIKSKA